MNYVTNLTLDLYFIHYPLGEFSNKDKVCNRNHENIFTNFYVELNTWQMLNIWYEILYYYCNVKYNNTPQTKQSWSQIRKKYKGSLRFAIENVELKNEPSPTLDSIRVTKTFTSCRPAWLEMDQKVCPT